MTHRFSRSLLLMRIGVLLFFGWTMFAVALQFPDGIVPSFAQSNNIPSAVNPCIPKAQVARAEVISSTIMQGKNYYLLAAYEEGDPVASDLIISTANKTCRREFYNPTGDRLALASAVPQTVARQLTLQRYQREIERIGRAAFELQVKQSRSGSCGVAPCANRWFDEEAWALQQLRIRSGKALQ